MISWGIRELQVSSLQWFRPAWWSSYQSPTTKHWHSHWQKPASSILRNPRESYDSGSIRCKIKHTWALLIPFAPKMWLTWYQVVDHVCYSQSNMTKGMCSIDDSLNTKVSPFFNTPFHTLYWLMGTKSTSSIKCSSTPPYDRSTPMQVTQRQHQQGTIPQALLTFIRSIGTSRNMYLIYLPIRPCLSTW